jgi:hypothetical protein
MTTRLSSLVLGLLVAVGVALGTIACNQPSPLLVSPSAAPVSGPDGSAAKGVKNFCAYVRAHESDGIYVVKQDVKLSLTNDQTTDQTLTSTAPHGEVCFAVPTAQEDVWIYIERSGFCTFDWVDVAVHNGPSYIWLLPDNGYHNCSYPEPY